MNNSSKRFMQNVVYLPVCSLVVAALKTLRLTLICARFLPRPEKHHLNRFFTNQTEERCCFSCFLNFMLNSSTLITLSLSRGYLAAAES